MEEISAYIGSGILELYVLGQLTPGENREVEVMIAKHPSVKEEVKAIELALEHYALANSIEPAHSFDLSYFEEPAPVENAVSEAKVVALNPGVNGKIRTLRFALVACVAFLIVSLAVLYSTSNKLDIAHAQIAQLNSEKAQFARNVNFFEEQNKELKLIAAMPDHPDWAEVNLKGVGKSPDARLLVYWNKKDHKVMLNNNNSILPAHDDKHQYQLWALVNGKPVDLGVFDSSAENSKLIMEMKGIEGAQAFAVTIEKLGGSPTPTMEQMVVMGGV